MESSFLNLKSRQIETNLEVRRAEIRHTEQSIQKESTRQQAVVTDFKKTMGNLIKHSKLEADPRQKLDQAKYLNQILKSKKEQLDKISGQIKQLEQKKQKQITEVQHGKAKLDKLSELIRHEKAKLSNRKENIINEELIETKIVQSAPNNANIFNYNKEISLDLKASDLSLSIQSTSQTSSKALSINDRDLLLNGKVENDQIEVDSDLNIDKIELDLTTAIDTQTSNQTSSQILALNDSILTSSFDLKDTAQNRQDSQNSAQQYQTQFQESNKQSQSSNTKSAFQEYVKEIENFRSWQSLGNKGVEFDFKSVDGKQLGLKLVIDSDQKYRLDIQSDGVRNIAQEKNRIMSALTAAGLEVSQIKIFNANRELKWI